MTPDELQKHGLRVTPLKRHDMDIVWQMNANAAHGQRIAAALEPIAPPDVAQAARVLHQHVMANCGTEVEEWMPILSAICARTGGTMGGAMNGLAAALRAIAGETP